MTLLKPWIKIKEEPWSKSSSLETLPCIKTLREIFQWFFSYHLSQQQLWENPCSLQLKWVSVLFSAVTFTLINSMWLALQDFLNYFLRSQQHLRLTVLQCRAHQFPWGCWLSPSIPSRAVLSLIMQSAAQNTLRVNQRTAVTVQTTIMGSSLLSGINYHCAPLKRKLIALGCPRCTSAVVASHKKYSQERLPLSSVIRTSFFPFSLNPIQTLSTEAFINTRHCRFPIVLWRWHSCWLLV